MPVPLIAQIAAGEFDKIPYGVETVSVLAKVLPWLMLVYALKAYFGGARNTSERNMHSKVVMITGATSGVGRTVASELALRGAQLVLLTHEPLSDPFLVDYIMDLRTRTSNDLITAEQVDLSSLHSIRKFATKWVDNAPPRRLDMIVLCANTMTPHGKEIEGSEDGVENTFQVNYLANFHLLSILSPALRAQPPDREVRIIFGACSSYESAPLLDDTALILPRVDPTLKPALHVKFDPKDSNIFKQAKGKSTSQPKAPLKKKLIADKPELSHSLSKLLLTTFALAFQKHLSNYTRPDKAPMNVRVLLANPGWSRTPGFRRRLTRGSIWGLLAYLLTYPLWWLFFKSADQGAQTFLHAAMSEEFSRGPGGWYLKECKEIKLQRHEVSDEGTQKKLWQASEKAIEQLEKEGAKRRASEKQAQEAAEKKAESDKVNRERKDGSRRDRKTK